MKIICIGRNYADHAKELKNEVPREPVFFCKPETAIPLKNQPVFYPDFTEELHYELELVVRINRLGKHIEEKFASRYYNEVSLGIDFTARDVQRQCKEKGLPWEKAKAFDGSAPVGRFIKLEELGNIQDLSFQLDKNGETVQKGHTTDMLFSVDQLIAHISKFFTLKIGDLIFTGTPAGVGECRAGDRFTGSLQGNSLLSVRVK